MKLALDFRVRVDDDVVDAKALDQTARERLGQSSHLEGAVVLTLDGASHCEEFVEPLLRLGDQWIRKLPWILAGDTETVAFRNSEHCFAFVPAGDSVELSFFLGSETEVEEYVVEPTTVRLETFANESIKFVERILELVRGVSAQMFEAEDCRDLRNSLEEGKKAWRDYQLHSRR